MQSRKFSFNVPLPQKDPNAPLSPQTPDEKAEVTVQAPVVPQPLPPEVSNANLVLPSFPALSVSIAPNLMPNIQVHKSQEVAEEEEQKAQQNWLKDVRVKFNAHQFPQVLDLTDQAERLFSRPLAEFAYYNISATRCLALYVDALEQCEDLMKEDTSAILSEMKAAIQVESTCAEAKKDKLPYPFFKAVKSRLALNVDSAVDYVLGTPLVLYELKIPYSFLKLNIDLIGFTNRWRE